MQAESREDMKRIWLEFPRPENEEEGKVIALALSNMYKRLLPKEEENVNIQWDNVKGYYTYEYTDSFSRARRIDTCNANGRWYTLIGIND